MFVVSQSLLPEIEEEQSYLGVQARYWFKSGLISTVVGIALLTSTVTVVGLIKLQHIAIYNMVRNTRNELLCHKAPCLCIVYQSKHVVERNACECCVGTLLLKAPRSVSCTLSIPVQYRLTHVPG